MTLQRLTAARVAEHNTEQDCWVTIDSRVYDLSEFIKEHPGGRRVLAKVAGTDASKEFWRFHTSQVLNEYGPKLCIGTVGSGVETVQQAIPTEDPNWCVGWNSPYYSKSHRDFQVKVRALVEEVITPFVDIWEADGLVPQRVFKHLGSLGLLAVVCGPCAWDEELIGRPDVLGVPVNKIDAFHELIVVDELSRCGSGGVLWALVTGISVGLGPVLRHGSPSMCSMVARGTLEGNLLACLAVTEPTAGSDVASLQTTATLSADGKNYIVNGQKKWITGGVSADWITIAVKTSTAKGISLMLVDGSSPGILKRELNCGGMKGSQTSFLSFENVVVPTSALIGKEGSGFSYIMEGFNHERWDLIVEATRMARICYSDAFKYAHERTTFGKRLIDHGVIRNKLAHMTRQIEATQAWLEQITYSMTQGASEKSIAGPLALCKVQASKTVAFCASEAMQVFGGLGYTRQGKGGRIERIYREAKAYAIPGGSEEIMLDLGVKLAVKQAKL